MAKKKKEKEESQAAGISRRYRDNLASLNAFVENVAPIVMKHDARTVRKIERITKNIVRITGKGERKVDEEGKESFKLSDEMFSELSKYLRELPRVTTPQAELLYRSSVVMLISYFDFLISDLVHCYHRMYPESLGNKELTISLDDLKVCGDINEAVELVINKKIESVLYGNLESQKEYLRRDLKIDLNENIVNWNLINEAVERRNIIIHNNGEINRRYLAYVEPSVIPEAKKDVKEGKILTVNEKYFIRTYEELLIAGIILIQCCWRKWVKDELELADAHLINNMYGALMDEKWSICERLGLFSRECTAYNTANRLYFDVNYCQSLKWQNKDKELGEELQKFDVSVLSPKYLLAVAALKSDKDGFYENVEKAIEVDKMEEEDFMKWPLFRELRKDEEYKQKVTLALERVGGKQRGMKNNEE